MSINNFARDNYTILFKGDQVDLSNLEAVEEFILADDHADLGGQLIHSTFINSFFNNPLSKVYVESQPLGVQLSEKKKQLYWLDEHIIAEGWDIGTIETIFALGMVEVNKKKPLSGAEVKNLFNGLLQSNNILHDQKLILGKIGKSSNTAARIMIINAMNALKKIKYDQELVLKIVDSTFFKRQISLVSALEQQGRKALIAGELHLYKKNENSNSLFDLDPHLSDGQAGRAYVQDKIRKRNAVVLQPQPQAAAFIYQKKFGPLMAEVASYFAHEINTGTDTY